MVELAVFAKFWQPGSVKTRLAQAVGDEAASRLYRGMLSLTLERFSQVADRRVLVFAPASKRMAFEALAGPAWSFRPQSDGDLGQRLTSFLARSFASGSRRVLVMGSDSPTIPRQYLDDAIQSLAEHDVVAGPTVDGGYYLIGMRRHAPELFGDIPWSTDQVWMHTVRRIEQRFGGNWVQLPPWYDVDSFDDLGRLYSDLVGDELSEWSAAAPLAAQIAALNRLER